MIEVQLIPSDIAQRYREQRIKVVSALAPSRTMAGPRTITFFARRIGVREWKCFYSRLWFYQREPKLPRIDQHLAWRDGGDQIYRFVRQTEIVVTDCNLLPDALGDDVRVVACDRIAFAPYQRGAQIGKLLRRVFYLDQSNPLDGLTTEHDETCISPKNHRLYFGRFEPSERQLEFARQCHARYQADIDGRAKGWEFDGIHQVWKPPGQIAAELAAQDEQRRFEKLARARG